MRQHHRLAGVADPEIAVRVAEPRMEEGRFRAHGRQDDHRIFTVVERILDHSPIAAMAEQVGSEDAAQRGERHTLFAGLGGGVHRLACRVPDFDPPSLDCAPEAGSRAELPERHPAAFDLANAARADEQIHEIAAGGQAPEA